MRSTLQNHFICPELVSLADECRAMLVHLIAYVGALALFAIVGLHIWDQLRLDMTAAPLGQPNFTLAEHSHAAFAVSSLDPPEKSESYEILRHPAGGRKDILRWGAPGEKPVAELEIYRPGGEFEASDAATGGLGLRIAAQTQPEAAGVIETKFGAIALFQRPGRIDPATSCLGFARRFGDSLLQISGWSCQGTTLPARRAAIGCMLDRLTLLASGNEPRLAQLFARAELKRSGCGNLTSVSVDWVTGTANPHLRGPL
jgi:hypothetical protein